MVTVHGRWLSAFEEIVCCYVRVGVGAKRRIVPMVAVAGASLRGASLRGIVVPLFPCAHSGGGRGIVVPLSPTPVTTTDHRTDDSSTRNVLS